MKPILTLALAFFTFSVFSQEKTTFYKNDNLRSEVSEKRAKVKLVEKRVDNSILFELYDLENNCLIQTEQYDTNSVPKGMWKSYNGKCELYKVRDFSVLKYSKNSDVTDSLNSEEPVFNFDEVVEPEYKDGDEGLFKFLGQNINYPQVSADKGHQGIVYVSFVIEVDGSVSDIVILKGIDPYIDLECYLVVSKMPKWKPATKDGVPVRVQFNLPISFTLR